MRDELIIKQFKVSDAVEDMAGDSHYYALGKSPLGYHYAINEYSALCVHQGDWSEAYPTSDAAERDARRDLTSRQFSYTERQVMEWMAWTDEQLGEHWVQNLEQPMSETREQQREQAIGFWKDVVCQGEATRRDATQHVREEKREEDADHTAETRRRGQSI